MPRIFRQSIRARLSSRPRAYIDDDFSSWEKRPAQIVDPQRPTVKGRYPVRKDTHEYTTDLKVFCAAPALCAIVKWSRRRPACGCVLCQVSESHTSHGTAPRPVSWINAHSDRPARTTSPTSSTSDDVSVSSPRWRAIFFFRDARQGKFFYISHAIRIYTYIQYICTSIYTRLESSEMLLSDTLKLRSD